MDDKPIGGSVTSSTSFPNHTPPLTDNNQHPAGVKTDGLRDEAGPEYNKTNLHDRDISHKADLDITASSLGRLLFLELGDELDGTRAKELICEVINGQPLNSNEKRKFLEVIKSHQKTITKRFLKEIDAKSQHLDNIISDLDFGNEISNADEFTEAFNSFVQKYEQNASTGQKIRSGWGYSPRIDKGLPADVISKHHDTSDAPLSADRKPTTSTADNSPQTPPPVKRAHQEKSEASFSNNDETLDITLTAQSEAMTTLKTGASIQASKIRTSNKETQTEVTGMETPPDFEEEYYQYNGSLKEYFIKAYNAFEETESESWSTHRENFSKRIDKTEELADEFRKKSKRSFDRMDSGFRHNSSNRSSKSSSHKSQHFRDTEKSLNELKTEVDTHTSNVKTHCQSTRKKFKRTPPSTERAKSWKDKHIDELKRFERSSSSHLSKITRNIETNSYNDRQDKTDRKLTDITQRLHQHEDRLREHDNEFIHLDSRSSDTRRVARQNKSQLERHDERLEDLESITSRNNRDIHKLKRRLIEDQSRLDQHDIDLEKLSRQARKQQSTMNTHEEWLEDLNDKTSDHNTRLRQHDTQFEKVDDDLHNVHHRTHRNSEEINRLKEKTSHFESDTQRVRDENHLHQTQLKTQSKRIERTEKDSQVLTKQLETLSSRVGVMSDELDQYKTLVEKLRSKHPISSTGSQTESTGPEQPDIPSQPGSNTSDFSQQWETESTSHHSEPERSLSNASTSTDNFTDNKETQTETSQPEPSRTTSTASGDNRSAVDIATSTTTSGTQVDSFTQTTELDPEARTTKDFGQNRSKVDAWLATSPSPSELTDPDEDQLFPRQPIRSSSDLSDYSENSSDSGRGSSRTNSLKSRSTSDVSEDRESEAGNSKSGDSRHSTVRRSDSPLPDFPQAFDDHSQQTNDEQAESDPGSVDSEKDRDREFQEYERTIEDEKPTRTENDGFEEPDVQSNAGSINSNIDREREVEPFAPPREEERVAQTENEEDNPATIADDPNEPAKEHEIPARRAASDDKEYSQHFTTHIERERHYTTSGNTQPQGQSSRKTVKTTRKTSHLQPEEPVQQNANNRQETENKIPEITTPSHRQTEQKTPEPIHRDVEPGKTEETTSPSQEQNDRTGERNQTYVEIEIEIEISDAEESQEQLEKTLQTIKKIINEVTEEVHQKRIASQIENPDHILPGKTANSTLKNNDTLPNTHTLDTAQDDTIANLTNQIDRLRTNLQQHVEHIDNLHRKIDQLHQGQTTGQPTHKLHPTVPAPETKASTEQTKTMIEETVEEIEEESTPETATLPTNGMPPETLNVNSKQYSETFNSNHQFAPQPGLEEKDLTTFEKIQDLMEKQNRIKCHTDAIAFLNAIQLDQPLTSIEHPKGITISATLNGESIQLTPDNGRFATLSALEKQTIRIELITAIETDLKKIPAPPTTIKDLLKKEAIDKSRLKKEIIRLQQAYNREASFSISLECAPFQKTPEPQAESKLPDVTAMEPPVTLEAVPYTKEYLEKVQEEAVKINTMRDAMDLIDTTGIDKIELTANILLRVVYNWQFDPSRSKSETAKKLVETLEAHVPKLVIYSEAEAQKLIDDFIQRARDITHAPNTKETGYPTLQGTVPIEVKG